MRRDDGYFCRGHEFVVFDGSRFLSELQSEAPAPTEPADAQRRDTDDCRLAAVVLFQLALGAGVVHRRLDLAICGTRDRGKSTCLFQEPRLPSGWTTLGPASGRSCVWFRQTKSVEVNILPGLKPHR